MHILEEVLKTKKKLKAVIKLYLQGKIDLVEFEETYTSQLEIYEEVLGDGGFYQYYDTGNLVGTLSKSKMMYKEDEISNLKYQLEELQSTNFEKLKKYYPLSKLTDKLRKKMCKNALFEINQQVKHVSVHNWVKESFVANDREFEFFDDNGESKLGSSSVLYRTPITKNSFLLSALSNTIIKPRFSIDELFNALEKVSKSQECFWVRCYDCDGVVANIEVVNSLYAKDIESTLNVVTPYIDQEQLAWFEENLNGQHQANGDYNLLLLSSDFSWMLKLSYSFSEWWIELHGKETFLSEFLKELFPLEKQTLRNALK